MAVDKKFFVDINLQGNALNNATIGSNSDMTKGGSFRFDGTRLEYYNGSSVQSVANLGDISAVTGGLIFKGGYDPTTNIPDIADGTAKKGYFWVATAAGTFLGESVQIGDSLVATVDNAGASIGDWLILQGNVVIATDTVDGIVRLATQEEVDDGTLSGAVVLTPATFENSYQLDEVRTGIKDLDSDKLSRDGSQAMTGSLDMAAHSIINLPAPTADNDAASKVYVDDTARTAQTNAENYATGEAAKALTNANAYTDSAISQEVTDRNSAIATAKGEAIADSNSYTDSAIAQEVIDRDAAIATAKSEAIADANSYTDSGLATKLDLAGGTMSGGIDMVSNAISNPYLSNATLINALNANGQVVTNLADPTDAQDAATKNYVDYQLGAQSFSSSFADTDWTYDAVKGYYSLQVVHNIESASPKVSAYVSGNLVEFAVELYNVNTIVLKSNIAAPASVSVGVSK